MEHERKPLSLPSRGFMCHHEVLNLPSSIEQVRIQHNLFNPGNIFWTSLVDFNL